MRKSSLFMGALVGVTLGATGALAVVETFNDVPTDHWAATAISNLKELGVVQGYDGNIFKPNNPVSRAEVSVMLDKNNKVMMDKMTAMEKKIADMESEMDMDKNVLKTDLQLAEEAMEDYFYLLNAKKYAEAMAYMNEDWDGWEGLRTWNPDVEVNDYAGLFKNACEINGLNCLKIKTVVSAKEISPTEFKFIVQFQNEDGTLALFGPCCGGTGDPKSDYEQVVKKESGKFWIQDGPVYTP